MRLPTQILFRKYSPALREYQKTNYQSYLLVVLISGLSNLFAWALGLVVGAIIAKEVAKEGAKRGMFLHYPLLVASAYAGFVIWHMGYSSSAALFVCNTRPYPCRSSGHHSSDRDHFHLVEFNHSPDHTDCHSHRLSIDAAPKKAK